MTLGTAGIDDRLSGKVVRHGRHAIGDQAHRIGMHRAAVLLCLDDMAAATVLR